MMLFRTDKFNTLTSNFDLNVLDQTQTDVVHPLSSGQIDLQVDLVDEITITGNLASNTLAQPRTAIDRNTPPFQCTCV